MLRHEEPHTEKKKIFLIWIKNELRFNNNLKTDYAKKKCLERCHQLSVVDPTDEK